MTPLSFDVETAKECVGDARVRLIEEKARADVLLDKYEPPSITGTTYWDAVMGNHSQTIYTDQYRRRKARMDRKVNMQ